MRFKEKPVAQETGWECSSANQRGGCPVQSERSWAISSNPGPQLFQSNGGPLPAIGRVVQFNHMRLQRAGCSAPCRRRAGCAGRARTKAQRSSSRKRRSTCQLYLAEHSRYPQRQPLRTSAASARRGPNRSRCRSRLLPTTRMGASGAPAGLGAKWGRGSRCHGPHGWRIPPSGYIHSPLAARDPPANYQNHKDTKTQA